MNLIWVCLKKIEFYKLFKIKLEKEKEKEKKRTWAWPNNQASPPSLLSQQGLGLGRSNRPSPLCPLTSLSLSLLSSPLAKT
jgi:hypothetical protein